MKFKVLAKFLAIAQKSKLSIRAVETNSNLRPVQIDQLRKIKVREKLYSENIVRCFFLESLLKFKLESTLQKLRYNVTGAQFLSNDAQSA